jgi:hypothetical protein
MPNVFSAAGSVDWWSCRGVLAATFAAFIALSPQTACPPESSALFVARRQVRCSLAENRSLPPSPGLLDTAYPLGYGRSGCLPVFGSSQNPLPPEDMRAGSYGVFPFPVWGDVPSVHFTDDVPSIARLG